MTKKIAVFVEGLTEQEFTLKLITELTGRRNISFEIAMQRNGHLSTVEVRKKNTATPEIHILIANCCCDNQVKSQIRDQYNNLLSVGYSMIIGLRDVFPFSHSEIPDLEENLYTGLPNGAVPIKIHLAIMEIEAWFLEEITHFQRIDSKLSKQSLVDNGFNPLTTRAHELPNPARTLDDIYSTVEKRYQKSRRQIQRTVNSLSYEELYTNVRSNSPSLDQYVSCLEDAVFN